MGLRDEIPAALQKGLAKSVVQAYHVTDLLGQRTPFLKWIVGGHALPHIRKAAVEFYAREFSSKHPHVTSEIRPNKSGNYKHVELSYKDRFVVTFHHLAKINGIVQTFPRYSHFAAALAESYGQVSLFEEQPVQFLGDAKIPLALLHWGNRIPEKVMLVIPDFENQRYRDFIDINLNIKEESDVEVIPDLEIELRKILGQEEGE